MRNRLLLLCALLVSVRGVSGAEERLSFDRPSRVGDFLQAEINLTAQREYRFVFPGPDRPVEKQESLVTTLFADLKILEVDPEGNALCLEIRISSAGGFLNGRRFDSSLLRGKTILADLKTSPARFTDASTGKPVPPEAKALLAAVFRPPDGDTLKATLGSSVPLRPGYKWKISAKPVLTALRARGLALSPDSISAEAQIMEREKYRGYDTCRVEIKLASSGVSTLDFRLRATVWIPEDPNVNMIRLLRNGVEVIDTVFPTENPLASGSSVRVITKENLEVILVPGKEKKALPKKRSWSDFILR